MFTKSISSLEYSDIDDLINVRTEREGYHLDFKREIGNPEKAKKELAKDISAFANSGGGYLIIGVDDKDYKIIGIDKTIQNKPVVEWLNQILNSNIEPQVYYLDPRIIPIQNSEKIIVVIHIPESTKKPHIVTEYNNYFLRINDISKSANHNQIRDMFEFSKNRIDESNNFLKKRHIIDEDDITFGINKNSNTLFSDIPQKLSLPKPIVLFSLIPNHPNEDKIKLSTNEFKNWLAKNSIGYEPFSTIPLYNIDYHTEHKLDGIIMKQVYDRELFSYFEILYNGYVEMGLSKTVTYVYQNKKRKKLEAAIYLTPIIGYEMLLLGFAKNLYDLANYYNDIILQISFINVENLKLYGFNKKYYNMIHYESEDISNKQHKNFKLNFRFNPKTLNDTEILSIAKQHSEKICNAFGLDKDYAFDGDYLSDSQMVASYH